MEMIAINKSKNKYQLFCEFVATHPTLYDGIDLDDGTIDYLNMYFYNFLVNPVDFERKYVRHLWRYGATYKQLKAIELNERIFDITTSETVRDAAANEINNLSRKTNKTNTSTHGGGYTDLYSGTETPRVIDTTVNKVAERELPMKTASSQGFDNLFNWSGASGINQNKNEVSHTGSNTANSSTIRTYNSDVIQTSDADKIKELGTHSLTNKETIKTVGGQVVTLVDKIWNYLVTPKAIDYLTDELEDAFILCY